MALVGAPIVKFVVEKLASKAWKELKALWKVDTRRLESKLTTIIDVLTEAESSHVAALDSNALYKWLNKLKDAAYDADDVVDEYHAEARRLNKNMVVDFFSSNNTFAFRHKMNKKLKTVMRTLDEILEDRQWLLLRDRSERSEETLDQARETSSPLIDSRIYGRDEDRKMLLKHLITENNDKLEVSVVAIAGLAGIGKTTLAQLVYNDEAVEREFTRLLWVWVSTKFNVQTILRKIIEQITNSVCNPSQIEAAHQRLKGLLSADRFLLVLDDVWTEDEQQWRRLLSLLRVGRKGSKILVTTRCQQVARMMDTAFTHQIRALSDDDCWEIFRDMAFRAGRAEATPHLEEIGRRMAARCGGLPLACEALGSLMGSLNGDAQWSCVEDVDMWRRPEDGTKILSSLKLTYHLTLPSPLKQCFAYCSLFPKQFKFDKEKFANLWAVEGFIPYSVEGMPAELIHTSCFDRFLDIYFFLNVEQQDNVHVGACEMHDVVQDLAWAVAGDEFLFAAGDKLTFKRSYQKSCVRYLSMISDGLPLDILNTSTPASSDTSPDIAKVRSLILLPRDNSNQRYHTSEGLPRDDNQRYHISEGDWERLLKLNLLRVLDLSATDISDLPQTISNLQQLRLLNLSNTDITTLPDTITCLHNLLILKLAFCRKLQQLPKGMSNMSDLLHLDVYGCHKLSHMPPRIGCLRKLRVFPVFIVGEDDEHTIKELQHLNQIGGRLQIKNLHNVKDVNEAETANLGAKRNLRQLELYWDGEGENAEGVAENLRPCQYLEELLVSGYKGNSFPSWMISEDIQTRLCRMKEVSIVNCKASSLASWFRVLHHLSTLEKLKISECEELTCLPATLVQQQIPSLRTLDVSSNKNLECLNEGGELQPPVLFASLHSLMLGNCQSLVNLPMWLNSLGSLKSLDLSACTKLNRLQQLEELKQVQITLPDLERRYREEMHEVGRTTKDNQPSTYKTENINQRAGFASDLLGLLQLRSCVSGSKVHD